MAVGKGGLSIIDYPFAFSIAALISPSFVQGDQFTVLMAITLIGGMFGSILTITNPVGLAINQIYRHFTKNRVLASLTKISTFTKGVVHKNFDAALRSPAVSFETDKLVGMFYFVVILSITIYRLRYDSNYIQIFNFSEQQIALILCAAVIGLLGVLAYMILNVIGMRSISHLGRINIATVLLVASDFKNLSTEAERVHRTTFSNDAGVITIACNTLRDADFRTIKNSDDLKAIATQQNDFRTILNRVNMREDTFYARYWYFSRIVVKLASRYGITPKDTLWWFKSTSLLAPNDLESYLPHLQSSIDSRDWHYADLQVVRISYRLEEVLMSKGGSQ